MERSQPPSTIDGLDVCRLGGPFGVFSFDSNNPPCMYAVAFGTRGGFSVRQAGQSWHIGEGDLLVLSARGTLRYRALLEDSELTVLSIADESARPHLSTFSENREVITAVEAGCSSLLGHVMAGVGQYGDSVPVQLVQHVVGMLAYVLETATVARFDERSDLVRKAKEYMIANLDDQMLAPDHVADALHVSTRTLYRVFEATDTAVSAWIRLRRLERCRVDLLDVNREHVPVSEIGARWGLCDAAHFSRLFKAQYGVSPHRYRVLHLRSLQRATRPLANEAALRGAAMEMSA